MFPLLLIKLNFFFFLCDKTLIHFVCCQETTKGIDCCLKNWKELLIEKKDAANKSY